LNKEKTNIFEILMEERENYRKIRGPHH